MKRTLLLLAILGLAVSVLTAWLQSEPGYMDADYYYMGGARLAGGHGFTEPVLWNYLDDPEGLPHPSHAYWMPLTSILAAAGLILVPWAGFSGAQIGFVLAAALVPPLTGYLAYRLNDGLETPARRRAALLAGLLALFSGYYLRFMTTTDTFALYMLLGGLFCLVWLADLRNRPAGAFALGMLAGLMHLARAEGFIWLFPALLSVFLFQSGRRVWPVPLAGYLLVMGPWFLRNSVAFGSALPAGNSSALWFTEYDQLFAYPASEIGFSSWWSAGPGPLLAARISAGWQNLQSALAVQGVIFLGPLMVYGGLRLRGKPVVRMGAGMWALLFILMSLIFPFAGARGGYFHAGAALQPLLWALVPAGLGAFVGWGARQRGWRRDQARRVFGSSLVVFALLVSLFLFLPSLPIGAAHSQNNLDSTVEAALMAAGADPADIVMVNNPPGYFIRTGRAAIVIPHGGEPAILAAGRRYGARYLVLESQQGLVDLYEKPRGRPGLQYIGDAGTARLFEVLP